MTKFPAVLQLPTFPAIQAISPLVQVEEKFSVEKRLLYPSASARLALNVAGSTVVVLAGSDEITVGALVMVSGDTVVLTAEETLPEEVPVVGVGVIADDVWSTADESLPELVPTAGVGVGVGVGVLPEDVSSTADESLPELVPTVGVSVGVIADDVWSTAEEALPELVPIIGVGVGVLPEDV